MAAEQTLPLRPRPGEPAAEPRRGPAAGAGGADRAADARQRELQRASPRRCRCELSVSRMSGGGYALLLRFAAEVVGPCMRCLKHGRARASRSRRARSTGRAAARSSTAPTCTTRRSTSAAWARDAFALAMPAKILCREDCAGLCPVCAADLNEAGPEHHHEPAPDPRWAKLRELQARVARVERLAW